MAALIRGAVNPALVNYFKSLGPSGPALNPQAFNILPIHLQPAAAQAGAELSGAAPSGGGIALQNYMPPAGAAGGGASDPGQGSPVGPAAGQPDDAYPAGQWEDENRVNPIGVRMRKRNPVKLLPCAPLLTAVSGTMTFAPQEAIQGFRILVPSGQASLPAYMQQLMVGEKMLTTTSGRIPLSMFSEKSQFGRVDMPVCYLGETITATISGGSASELSAVLLGYTFGTPRARFSKIRGVKLLPFDVTSVAATSTATIQLKPQEHVVPRAVVFDDTVTNVAGTYVTAFNVENQPQFAANQEIAIQAFSELAQDDWLDCHVCHRGGEIDLTIRNGNGTAFTGQGMIVCDVVDPID